MNDEIARQWLGKSRQEKGFNKFICLWIPLNILYSDKEGIDRTKCVLYFSEHSEILELETTKSFIKFIQERPGNGVINLREKEDSKYRINRIENSSSEEIGHCLYTIRCNVFHGDKSLHNQDNIDLLEKSSNLLNEFLSTIFK